jgi:outer membrane protein
MKTTLTAVFLALGLAVSTACAQENVTLDDAIKLALKNNRQLEMARLDREKADYRVNEALGNALPNISASGSYSRAIEKSVFFFPDIFSNPPTNQLMEIEVGADNSYQFGLQATQILYNQMVFTGVGTAKIYQKATREMYRGAYNATIAGVKKAFYGALFAEEMFRIATSSVKNAEENLHTVEILNKQGIVSDYDFIRASVQVDNARPMLIEAERNVVLARNGLKMTMGLSPSSTVAPLGELAFEPFDDEMIANAEQTVIANNASLKALEMQRQVNEEMISIYRAESFPMLSAFGNAMWQSQKNDGDKFGVRDLVRSSSVGLNLSLNLFNGFQTNSRIGQAQVDYRKSQEQFQAATDGFLTQVQNIKFKLAESRRRVESQGRTVQQAEKGYKIAQTRYSAGAGTLLEINDADLALMRARGNRIQAIFDYSTAKADLEELLSLAQTENQ